MMDGQMDKEHILRALESLGIDAHTERFNTEIHHLATLFSQGQTAADALQTVSDPQFRVQLKPALYVVILRALVLALARMDAITSEQTHDLILFLSESIGVLTPVPRQGNVGNGQERETP